MIGDPDLKDLFKAGMFESGADKLIDLLVSATELKSQLSENGEREIGKVMFFEGIETSCSIKKSKLGRLPWFKYEELPT